MVMFERFLLGRGCHAARPAFTLTALEIAQDVISDRDFCTRRKISTLSDKASPNMGDVQKKLQDLSDNYQNLQQGERFEKIV